MFKYLSSFFYNNPDSEISLDDAYKILQSDNVNENVENNAEAEIISSYDSITKIGEVTDVEENFITIDNKYKVPRDSSLFMKGSKVTYKIYVSQEQTNITDVNLIENNWDVIVEQKLNWCSRTLVCKVDKREGRTLLINPGQITIDLNKISSEFVPIKGDWLQVDVNRELDENVVDLGGKILEITGISPLRPQILVCTVKQWNNDSYEGCLDNRIYFNKESLAGGYIPFEGDRVIAEIIESDQGRFTWRALKIVPDFIRSLNNKKNVLDDTEFCTGIDGIVVEPPEVIQFDKLNEQNGFSLMICNNTGKEIFLNDVQFPKENSQCFLSKKHVKTEILSNQEFYLHLLCLSKQMGESREYILLKFDKGDVGIWLNISVGSRLSSNSYYNKRHTYKQRENLSIVKGEKNFFAPRFIGAKCPNYELPRNLLNLVIKYEYADNPMLYDELLNIKPCLSSNLSFYNYLDRFHTLLSLEEIQLLIEINTYDQDNACFIENGEFLMLEIANLSERRPSLIAGDKIIAKDSLGIVKTAFEGFIHKVGAKHIYLKFSSVFHDKYNGEDYSIHAVASRSQIRRLHYAVDLATKNLGSAFLFPSKVVEKEPQISFVKFTNSENNILSDVFKDTDTIITPKQAALQKVRNYKNKIREEKENSLYHQNNPNIKLDWYNKTLNCYQKQAVQNILLGVARPLPYIIFGPPGTGKTITVVETILQILRLIPSSRLLVTTPSNSSADLLALRLINSKVLKPGDLIRLVSNNYAMGSLIPPILAPYCATADYSKTDYETHQSMTNEQGLLLGANSGVIGRHRITISTCSSAGHLYKMNFPKGHFTHIIVDEAGQATEPEIMIPLAFLDVSTGQAILAGDHLQLGPVVISKLANETGLGESYMERILNRFPYIRDPDGFSDTGGYDPRLVTKLLHNYRAMPSLLNLTSSLFYNNDLIATISETNSDESRLLANLEEILDVNPKTNKLPNIVFHSVIGENYQTADSPSWYNPSEVGQIFFYVNELYRLGLTSKDIAIISPYIKQIKEVRNIFTEAEFEIPKIGSIEELQGQEYNVVILSTVRSTTDMVVSDIRQNLGFISAPKRLNVAVSRAKVLLIIIGNSDLLYTDKYWQTIIDYAVANGNYVGYSMGDY